MPKVSVIVPSYNHAPYLRARLESIRQQTFQDFELIVLDDASTDGSVEVIQEFAARYPARVVLNERNTGSPFIQWRRGAELASGEYLWVAESDDLAAPTFVETLVALLERDSSIGLAYCQSTIVDEDGVEHGTWREYTDWIDREHWRTDYINRGRDECAEYLVFANTIPNASAVLSRRRLFLEASQVAAGLRLCGDWLTWARMLLLGDVAFVSTSLNYHRKHQRTVRSKIRFGQHFSEYTRVWHYLAKAFRSEPPVRARLRHALNVGWSNQCINMRDEDDWGWFVRLLPMIIGIGPSTLPRILGTYLEWRLNQSRAVALARAAKRRVCRWPLPG